MRVIDGKQPELSENDRAEIKLIASVSRIDGILLDGTAQIPPASIFGDEPTHEWCYYYQKASLARQQGDWQSVAALGDKALAEGFYPSDKIEWLPFMQANIALGQNEKNRRFMSIIGESPYIQKQVCTTLTAMCSEDHTCDPKTLNTIKETFCK
jgi:hypothetical protein